MRSACFIPIKANSERVPGKNFRVLNGKKLYQYICEHVKAADVFDDVFIDTNSQEIAQYAVSQGFRVIERVPELALNTANGNDLLVYHAKTFPDYDYYFQLFATAPYLQPESIRRCHDALVMSNDFDSCFTATRHHGFFWFAEQPVNYRPMILPRSQDLHAVVEETTGMYGITAQALHKYQCRIGSKPYMYFVDPFEAVDINTEMDLLLAEYVGREYWKIGI